MLFGEGSFGEDGVEEDMERMEMDADRLDTEADVYEIFSNNIQSSILYDTARSLQVNYELLQQTPDEIFTYLAHSFYKARFPSFRYAASIGVILFSPKLDQFRYFYAANNSRLSLFGVVNNVTDLESELSSARQHIDSDFVFPEQIVNRVSTEHSLSSDWVLWRLTNIQIRMMYL